ncbi:MAG: carbohydrate-binding domain-containing protein [Paramuribaculum sp.]|nr:carbohydrate-binding domain-containing protein [Paramuribaculum sp.]
MKRLTLSLISIILVSAAALAQNLYVNCGPVTYVFPSDRTGSMPYGGLGTTLEIMGKTFTISDINSMYVASGEVTDNLVTVAYQGSTAEVTVAGNIARYLDVTVDGAYVTIAQSAEVSETTCGEITYRLSGTSTSGAFAMSGSFKASVELNGLTLTSERGAAIDIQNGKRIAMRLTEGTVNTLADASGGTQKGCIVCKGHLEFKQKGRLIVSGNTAHGIYAKEYIEIKNADIEVNSAVKDGVNCNQYFLMQSGNLTISGVGDDGLQTSFKDDIDREAEDTGSITISGGTINVDVTATAAKAIKADGAFTMTAGTITASTSGHGKWDATAAKTKASSCISADSTITISGGTLNLTSTGGGGKGISGDGVMTFNGGEINVTTSGGIYAYVNGSEYTNYTGNTDQLASDSKSSPKGIKCDSDLTINGGTFNITTTGNGAEGIESKAVLTINDGTVKVRANDDAINSSSHMYITGGTVDVVSTGNDGLDSNGNMYISGGTVTAFGASSPECGIDVNDEYGYKLYITGGYVLGVGGNNSSPTSATDSQAYLQPSISVAGGSTLSVATSSETLHTFNIPSDYTGSTSGGMGGGPGGGGWGGGWGGPGGNSSSGVLISIPSITSGTSYTVKTPSASTSATAKK